MVPAMQHLPTARRHAGGFALARCAPALGATPTLPATAPPADAIACSDRVADASCVAAGRLLPYARP
jgi:hypothetical protein